MTNNKKLNQWVKEWADICHPDKIHWCDGSEEENLNLFSVMVNNGSAIKLNDPKRPGSYYFQSEAGDAARTEDRTFICSKNRRMLGLQIIGAILLR